MLTVKTPGEALQILSDSFTSCAVKETVSLFDSLGRVLYEPVTSSEYIPDFNRSTVDGYAVCASDTFGCSDSIPAILEISGEVLMGQEAKVELKKGCAIAVPTGGAIPEGADCVVMIEYTEDYGDGTIGILKPAAPGTNMIFRGDDTFPGKEILKAGRVITSSDIGSMAAMGIYEVNVCKKPVIGIISTGDELIDIKETPMPGQIRDVNSSMVASLCVEFGAIPVNYGIVIDDEPSLNKAVDEALSNCDAVIISGGSSVGVKDASVRVIESKGELLLHGLAIKPGKPTILGKSNDKAILGLPGHPVAAFFISHLMLKSLIAILTGRTLEPKTTKAVLLDTISANDGRAQYVGVRLHKEDGTLFASAIRGKSGLITTLAASDGYFIIPRDTEGYKKGSLIDVHFYTTD